DYLADTGHLTTTQHGAYLLLMMHYWRKLELPDDDKQLAAIAKLPLRIWLDSKETIQSFFHDGWKHKRIESELQKRLDVSNKRAEAGAKGGKSRAEPEAIATDLLKQNASMLHTHKQKKESKSSEANASGADAPIDPAIAEREYFARGKVVFGKSSGGLLANLLKSKGGNVALARAAVEMASTKENPAQYVGAMIRNPTAKPLTEHQRQQHETRGILDAMDDFTGRCDEGRSQNLELLPDYSGERSQDVRGRLGQGSLGIPGGRH
ncbi:MAG: DUF1376 domain-containing protein, partial [Hyphomicrobiales bacterium]|nr:DUF1376 domain-containing protein [Hyphomicrobiales bacterium]